MAIVDGPLPAPPGDNDNSASVEGRSTAPPSSGFGQLWRKEVTATLRGGPTASELMAYWKAHLPELWPETGELHRSYHDIQRGDLLGIDLGVGPVKLATGVVVIESSDTSFTVLSPEGHMFAGWNRFTTQDIPEGTVAAVTIEMRASDPFYEAGLLFGGHRAEERFWAQMLWNLAERFGQLSEVRVKRRLLDRGLQWDRAGNIRHNAFLRTSGRRLLRVLGLGGR